MIQSASGPVAPRMRGLALAVVAACVAAPGCHASDGDARPESSAEAAPVAMARVRPQVSLANVTIKGIRKEEKIRAVLETAIPQFRSCYEQIARELPRKPGKLLVHMSVYPNGTPDTPTILGGQFSHHGFETCLSSVLKELSFGNQPRAGTSEVMLALDLTLDVRAFKTLE